MGILSAYSLQYVVLMRKQGILSILSYELSYGGVEKRF
jgi:hypothetical protein